MVSPGVMYGCENWTIKKAEGRRIDAFELCFWRRLENPLDCNEIQTLNPKGNQSWIFFGRTDTEIETLNMLASWCEEPTHWERPWCWERLKVGGKGDDRGWDGWMASPTLWTWVWVSSGNWWRTGKPIVLQSMGLQRVRQDWMTELYWLEFSRISSLLSSVTKITLYNVFISNSNLLSLQLLFQNLNLQNSASPGAVWLSHRLRCSHSV